MLYFSTLSIIVLTVGLFTSRQIIELGQILLFLSAGILFLDNLKNKTLALPKSAYFLLVFILVALISIWVNVEDISRPSYNWNRLKYPLSGVLAIYVFRYWLTFANDKIKKTVINIFFASIIFSSIYGIVYFFTENQSRMDALIQTSRQAYNSSFFLITLFSILLYRDKFKHILNSKYAVTTFIVTFIAMLLTFSRAPMFSFLCAIPFALFFYKRKLAYIFGVISLIIGLTAVSYYFIGSENTSARFLITKENQSDTERKSLWLAAIYAIKERPVLGWGYYNLKTQMKQIKEKHDLPQKHLAETHSHNNYLEIAANTGFLGLIPFLGWLIFWMIDTFKSNWGRRIFVPFGVVYVMTSQVDGTIVDAHMSTFIYLIYAFSSVIYEREKQPIL